jgi:hypothetical protein
LRRLSFRTGASSSDALAGIALKLLFGGLGLLKKLFAALLRIQLPAIVPVAILVFALIQMGEARHQHKRADHAEQEAATKQKSIDNILDGQAKANALAKAEKRRVEATYAQIQKDNAHALTLARADADARLRDWMRTHRADQGGSRQPICPGIPTPPADLMQMLDQPSWLLPAT